MKAKLASKFAVLAILSALPAQAQSPSAPPPPPTMEQISAEVLKGFLDAAKFQFQQDQKNKVPDLKMRRPVFTKSHGCVVARFDIVTSDPAMSQGVFDIRDPKMPKAYAAWIRFSNDGAPGADNVFNGETGKNPNRGMAIKLVGVPGQKILEGETNAPTQDFIMENHPVFFVDDAPGFLDLMRDPNFRQNHPKSDEIMKVMEQKVVDNPLNSPYWTPTPYGLGAGRTFKYSVKPTVCQGFPPSKTPNPMTDPDFLHKNLAASLLAGPACFDFFGQPFMNETVTPTDKAMTEWTETASTPRLLGRITINRQDINRPGRAARCESLSFNGWHAVPAHTPAGSLNLLRKKVYQESAHHRGEPSLILPTE